MAVPYYLSNLARPYAELGQLDDAWRCIGEAITAVEATKERWCEAEVNRVAGEIALKSPEPDAAKAQGYFQRALEIAHQQQAKSGELRAAMSMRRHQGRAGRSVGELRKRSRTPRNGCEREDRRTNDSG